MLSISVLVFSTGQRRLLKETLKYLHKRVDFGGVSVRWLIGDDYVDHPKVNNEECRSFILETGLFGYRYFPDSNRGLGHMVNRLYEEVDTPYALHLEHDWKFMRKIHIEPLLEIMEEHEDITCIRFNKSITKALPLVFWLGEADRQKNFNGIALTQTRSWTFNPTIYRSAHVKRVLPIDEESSERSFKAKMDAIGYRCFSLGKPGETYVKHLRGISHGRY